MKNATKDGGSVATRDVPMDADEAGARRALKAHPAVILAMTTERGWHHRHRRDGILAQRMVNTSECGAAILDAGERYLKLRRAGFGVAHRR